MSVVSKMAEEAVAEPRPGADGVGGVRLTGIQEAAGFVCDQETGDVVRRAFEDQGATCEIHTGGIAAAIAQLSRGPSPRLLVVDLSESDAPMNDIDGLAEVCDPGTNVIAVGAANDVGLFRDLLASGVADYLVKPVTVEAVGEAVVNATVRVDAAAGPAKLGKVIAFIGARGGVGCSAMALNCADIIAREQGRRVALVDLDLQFGTVALALDVEAGHGLREALENPARIDSLFVTSAAVNAGKNLFVLAAEEPLDGPLVYDPDALDLLLGELRQSFGCVVLDVPRATAVANWRMLQSASAVVVVSDLSLPGMRDTMRLVGMAKTALPETRVVVLANRAGADRKSEIPQREFEKSGDIKVDFVVPDDVKTFSLASHSGKPLLAVAKKSKATAALRSLSRSLVGTKTEAKRPPLWRRLFKG